MRLVAAFLLLLAGGCAHLPPSDPPTAPLASVDVQRDGDLWTAEYLFSRDAGAWVFPRSALEEQSRQAWRPAHWEVLTPGVRLERRGNFDLLAAEDGGPVPRAVSIRIVPAAVSAVMNYDPFLIFSDGSVALYTEQFDVLPLPDPEAAGALGFDLHDTGMPDGRVAMRFTDRSGPVLHGGERQGQASTHNDADTYILFGAIDPVADADMAAILDPALPSWIGDDLSRSIPMMIGHYADRLGPRSGPRPTVMATWAGPTPGLISAGGSVLPGLVVMRLEGVGLFEETDRARHHLRWFVAHEAAHFWLGQEIGYENSTESWITEGGAELLAIRAVAALGHGETWRGDVGKWVADCIDLSRDRGVATARDRGEDRAYYACGALFAMIAEAASDGDFFAFVRRLIADHRDTGRVGRAQWLAALDRAWGNSALSAGIAAMLDDGAADPAAAIARLFTEAGIAWRPDDAGRPIPL